MSLEQPRQHRRVELAAGEMTANAFCCECQESSLNPQFNPPTADYQLPNAIEVFGKVCRQFIRQLCRWWPHSILDIRRKEKTNENVGDNIFIFVPKPPPCKRIHSWRNLLVLAPRPFLPAVVKWTISSLLSSLLSCISRRLTTFTYCQDVCITHLLKILK